MASYTCEEPSICGKFQSAICSHCNRRLCHEHIVEHKNIVTSLTTFTNDIETVVRQINTESQNRKYTYDNLMASVDRWRRIEMEKLDAIYRNHLKSIESERIYMDNTEMKLLEQLESQARKPLAHLKTQRDVPMKSIDDIKQTIQQVRIDNQRLRWQYIPPIDLEHPPKNNAPRSNTTNEKIISKTNKNSSNCACPQNRGRPLKRLLIMLNNAPYDKVKDKITNYLEGLHKDFRLPIVICTYLTVWYEKTRRDEKNLLLNETVKTIEKYSNKCRTDFDVLIGLQIFFENQNIKENKIEMMTFLLQFFLDHRCIDRVQIFKWFNNQDEHGVHAYKGFQQAKQLATSFIRILEEKQTAIVVTQPIKVEPI